MKSVVIKRSILINGRRTSVSLENEFWEGLHEIADRRMIAHSTLVEQIDQERDNINLSSAIRVFVFNYFRTPGGVKPAGNFKLASDYGCWPNGWRRERSSRISTRKANCPCVRSLNGTALMQSR
ncbi:MAG: ribbon-helix-helix domain-containing protein [Pseudolabrys sp.]